MFFQHKILHPVTALLLSIVALSVHAVENNRLLLFTGQPVPAPGVGGTVSVANGTLVAAPGNGTLTFPADHSYIFGTPGANPGTTITLTPSSLTVPSRIGVFDQRASSSTRITATCLNPLTLILAPCDLSNTTLFPRTFNPVSAAPYTAVSDVTWDGALNELTVSTPGVGNIQSNGVYIGLSPYVRSVTYRTTNTGTPEFIAIRMLVADAPSVTKAFAPAMVQTGGRSTLTITLKNPDLGAPVPGVNLTDVLPAPLKLVSVATTCTGGTLTGPAGTDTISLTGATMPTAGCTITAEVEWPQTPAGISACLSTPAAVNTITAPAQFTTALGQLATIAAATLACSGVTVPPVVATAVPGLDEGGLLMTSAGIGLLAAFVIRRRKKLTAKRAV